MRHMTRCLPIFLVLLVLLALPPVANAQHYCCPTYSYVCPTYSYVCPCPTVYVSPVVVCPSVIVCPPAPIYVPQKIWHEGWREEIRVLDYARVRRGGYFYDCIDCYGVVRRYWQPEYYEQVQTGSHLEYIQHPGYYTYE